MLNKNTFREYDIRGIYQEELDESTAYLVGRAFGSNLRKLGKTNTVVGHDNRVSSPSLEKELVKGILETGINVTRLGLVTTPMYYYACNYYNTNCGIMVTASHNPKNYNGFKFSYNGIHNTYGKQVSDLYDIIINEDFVEGSGIVINKDIKEAYITLLLKDLKLGNNKIKVIYDCGNGTTSIVAKDIFNKLNIESIPLFDISDGNFPNHHPDPSVEDNLKELKKMVLTTNANVGLAFDGDGDRVGVVDEVGNMIDIDMYMLIMWRDIYNKVNNKKALFDVKCSKALEDELIKLDIEPVCYRTGNSYMKEMSARGNFPLGGELSGHVFYRDRFPGYDDGIYAGLRLVEVLTNTNKSLSSLLEGVNKYYSTKELKIKVDDNIKGTIIEKVKEYCIEKKYKILTIDGVKVLYNDGFALIRQSNTSPNITMRFEATTKERLESIHNEFIDLLNKLL